MDKALQLRVIAALQDKLSGPLNKIKGSSAASAQGVADLRSKLKALDVAQREVGRFREVSRGLQATRAELTAAQQRVAGLAQQMQTTASPTRAMTREFDRAVRAAQQLKEKHGQQSVEPVSYTHLDVYKRQPKSCHSLTRMPYSARSSERRWWPVRKKT